MFRICQGLKTSYTINTIQEDYNDIEEMCIKDKNCYLVYNEDEIHKIYFDIDMKKEEYEKIGTYEEVKEDLLNAFKNTLSKYSTLSIAEANKKDYKISYRIVMNDYKMKIKEMKEWIKNVRCEFDDVIKNTIDLMPYMSNGKIRLPHCSKEGEDRPFRIIEGKFKDFLTIKTDKATLIDWDEIKPKELNKVIDKVNKVIRKDKFTNNKVSDEIMIELLDNLDYFRCNDYKEWSVIGMALNNDGYDIKLYKHFSMRSKKYTLGCEIRKWQQFKDYDNPISTASLWYYLSKDNNEKYLELRDKVDLKNYDFKLDLTEDIFDEKKCFDLIHEDLKTFGFTEYIKRFFNKSKSFNYFNHYHFMLSTLNMCFRINFNGNKKEITFIELAGYTTFEFESSENKMSFDFISLWKKNINKQSYLNIDFQPRQEINKNTYNLFNGFVYEDENKNIDESKIKNILNHIKYLCNEEKIEKEEDCIMYQYILNWISHIIQKPARKTESALVFFSNKHGVGKNAFTDILEKIFDGYAEPDVNLEGLVGHFNSNLKAKLLIIADEVAPTAKELNDKLKTIITRKKINIEYKGKEKIKILDATNYIFTTNNELAFRITDEDRRFCLIECPEYKKNDVYFTTLYKDIEDDTVIKNLFNFFLMRDIKDVNIRNIPITQYKKRNIMHNLPPYIKMIKDCPENFLNQKINSLFINNQMNQYCKDHNIFKKDCTEKKIGMDMTKYFKDFKRKTASERFYYFDSLEKLREHIKITFEDDEYIDEDLENIPDFVEPKEEEEEIKINKRTII